MESQGIKISVVVSVYNDEDKIEACINSILEQSFTDFEVICVDEGSKDNTLQMLYDMQIKDKRMQVYWRKAEKQGDARRFALNIAKGEYIYFIDACVILKNDLLEKVYRDMSSHEAEMALFIGRTCNMQIKKGKNLPYSAKKSILPPEKVFDGRQNSVLGYFSMELWTKAFKTEYMREVIKEELFEEDTDFAMILATVSAERIVYTMGTVVNYRKENVAGIPCKDIHSIDKFFEKYYQIDKKLQAYPWYNEIHTGFLKLFMNEAVLMYEMSESIGTKSRFLQNIMSEEFEKTGALSSDEEDKTESCYKINGLIRGQAWKKKFDSVQNRDEWTLNAQAVLDGEAKVSIIVPCYNIEKFVGECLDSLINQTLEEIEIICVNDGSSDGTLGILMSYAQKDKRITVVSQENGGLSVARNTGVKNATGAYICFVDSDDLLELNALEELYRDITKGNHDILFFDADSFFESGELQEKKAHYIDYYIRKYDYTGINNGAELLVRMLQNDEYRQSACLQLIRRQYFLDKELWFHPGILHEDNAFTFKAMLNSNNIAHVNKVFYLRRLADNSIMTSNKSFAHSYGYFVSLLDMQKIITEVELSEEQQVVVTKLLTQVINNSRGLYTGLQTEDKYFFECLDPLERELYYNYIVSYAVQTQKIKDGTLDKKAAVEKKNLLIEDKNEKIQILRERVKDRDVKVKDLKKQFKAEKKKAKKLKKEIEMLREEMEAIKNSKEYQLGNSLLKPFKH